MIACFPIERDSSMSFGTENASLNEPDFQITA
jgi:hypothetical protein